MRKIALVLVAMSVTAGVQSQATGDWPQRVFVGHFDTIKDSVVFRIDSTYYVNDTLGYYWQERFERPNHIRELGLLCKKLVG